MKIIICHILFAFIMLLVSCSKDEEVDPSPADPIVNISASDLVFSDTGTEPSSFTITSDAPWAISFSDTKSAPAWCKVEPTSGNKGTTNVVVTMLQDNDSYDDRSTNMKIVAGQTVKIISIVQKKKNAIILSKNKFEVGPDESTIQVNLKTNVEYSVEIPEEYALWIIKGSASKTKGLQDKSEIFTIKEGTVEGAKEGLIIFKSGELKDTVSVFQAQKNALILIQKEYNLSNEATSIEVELRSNIEYEVFIPKEAIWVSKSQTRAMRTDVLSFSVDKNEAYDNRTTKIAIKDKNSSLADTLIIHQAQVNAIILSKKKIEVGPDESTIQVDLKTNIEYSIEIPEEYTSWIVRGSASKTKGLQDKSEIFTIKEGTVDGARVGLIIFKSGELKDTVSVFQTQKNALILTQKEYNLSNEATSIEVELRSNVEYEVVIPKEAVWVKKSQTRAMRTDVLSFSMDKNDTYDNRTTKIAIKDKNSSLSDTLIIHQLQLNAIFIDSNKIDVGYSDLSFSIKVKSNIAFTFNIPQEAQEWIKVSPTRGLEESLVNFTVNVNNEFDREVVIPCTGNNNTSDTLYVKQEGVKTILMDFYNATGGNNWHNNTNWGSEKPINEWYGITVSDKTINRVDLSSNNLNGSLPISIGKLVTLEDLRLGYNENLGGNIPEEIGLLSNLTVIWLMYNNLSGNIPKSIGSLTNLNVIYLYHNNLTGTIPDDIGNLSKLYILDLFNNKLTGTIPSTLGHLKNCSFSLNWNYLSGPIPNSILTQDNWTINRDYIIYQNGYTIYPPLEYSILENHENKDLNLQPVNSHDVFVKNKYTILYNYSYECGWSLLYTPTVVDLFEKYKNKGLGVISYHACILSEGKLPNIKNYVAQEKMGEFINLLNIGEYIDTYGSTKWDKSYFFGGRGTPEVMVVDNQGRLCWGLAEDRDKLPEFIKSVLGEPEPEKPYESTDFSKDGEVLTLQQAAMGKGINLVILGDGFVDKDMNPGGKYEAEAKEAMEHFFAKEPVKTFRNRFNVYCVKAVSLNEGIGEDSQTVFSSAYGGGTYISGDNEKCFEYTLKVPAIKDISNVTVITILNDPKYAGICWMYGNNASIAYCPLVAYDSEQFAQILQHEAIGHGFGKLADEYAYPGRIPQSEIDNYTQMYNTDGWWSNIDFMDNPSTIKWNNFLSNSLYSNLVGIYEGGVHYEFGVYRPTENSIMRYNVGEFNAPSRLAIYKRIMNLSGETYSYDRFLEYDHINRVSTRAVYAIPKDFVPLAPPVVVRDK